eukprot:Nitzschia sp. Nitz4//scaffold131_size63436//22256//25383//NITZ4_006271-RA/size63436-snap-gene-0.33-mRNA-1//1//CDS//3329535256//5730//frame0
MSKPGDHILEKAIIRCKKAQAVARPYNQKKKIKAGMTVEKKLQKMLDMTRKENFGELGEELEALANMIENMQKGILEPLLESVETIERRMHSYIETNNKSQGSLDAMEIVDEEAALTVSQADFKYDAKEASEAVEEVEAAEGKNIAVRLAKKQDKAKTSKPSTDGEEKPKSNNTGSDMTVNQRRFFERLEHFFELQNIAEERVAMVDPQGKIASMKVKSHSRGIQEKNGTFKAGYRQQDLHGEPVKYLADLYRAAEEALPEFKVVLHNLVDSVQGLEDEDVEMGEMKHRDRATEKAQEEYAYRQPGPQESWLYDILRASVVCKTYKQFSDINKWLKENMHIVECENRFATPQFDGYRDILYYISVPYKDELAFICEIEVHHKEFRKHFGISSHKVYFRPYFAGPFREDVDTLRDLDMLLQFGNVDETLMEQLMGSTDPSQLKLFGRIFFEKLEEPERARELFKRVLTMEEASLGKGHVMTGTTYRYLGLCLLSGGDPDGALIYLREGLSVMQANLGSGHPEIAVIHNYIGEALRAKGDYNEALLEFKECLAIREDALGEDHLLVTASYLTVAQTLLDKGEYKKAIAECRTALIIQESIFGEDDVNVSPSHILVGDILVEQGEFKAAIDSYNKALTICENSLGKKHAKTADILAFIGVAKMKQGDYDEAESYHQKALGMRETMLGKDHGDCATSYANLGAVLQERGDLDGALNMLQTALKMRTKTFGRNNYFTSESYHDVGKLLIKKGDYDDALSHFKDCLMIRKVVFGKYHPKTATAMSSIGRLKVLSGDVSGAQSELKKALGILERVLGSSHPEVANTYQYIGEACSKAKDDTKALENHSKALGIRTAVLGKHHPDTVSSCIIIAELLEKKGDLAGAKMALRQAVTANEVRLGDCHVDTATSRLKYGNVLSRKGEYDDAEAELRKAVAAREEIIGQGLETAEAYASLGSLLSRRNDYGQAAQFHQKALDIQAARLGSNHPDVAASKACLEAAKAQKPEDAITV